MARKDLIRRRPRKGEADDPPQSTRPGTASSRRSVIDETRNVVERTGPVQAIRRKNQGIREAIATPAGEEKVEVNLEGLEALARMDADDLAALYDAQPLSPRVREGDRVQAVLIREGQGEWLVDIGTKAEASLDAAELRGAQPGDRVEVWVIFSDGEYTRVSTRLQGSIASSFLDEALANGIPVQGTVQSRSSGGYAVRVGDQSAFCPISHIDRLRSADPDQHVGKTYDFLVLETGEKTVLSRRRLQEQALQERTATLWATLQPGEAVQGVVTRAADFGVFVDVDGVEGLLPRSAITSDREADLSETFPSGRIVELDVQRVDRDQKRISFLLRGGRRPRPAQTREERAPASAGESGFGTLGDLLSNWKK